MIDIRNKYISCKSKDIEECQKFIFINFNKTTWVNSTKKYIKKVSLPITSNYYIYCTTFYTLIFDFTPFEDKDIIIKYETLKNLLRIRKLEKILNENNKTCNNKSMA